MENVYVINGANIFSENAIILANKFNIKLVTDFKPKARDIYIVFGAHDIALQLLEQQKKSDCVYIIMNSEQIGSVVFENKFYIQLMKNNFVFDYNHLTSNYLEETFEVKVLSYFFFDFMKLEPKEKTIDILFIGTENENRKEIRDKLQKEFPDKKIEFIMDWSLTEPIKVKEKLSEAKYVLNIPYYTQNSLETHRVNNALSCGATVVSLNSKDAQADAYYNDYIYFTDDLIEFFKNEDEVSKKSYEELIKDLTGKIYHHNLFIIKQLIDKVKNF